MVRKQAKYCWKHRETHFKWLKLRHEREKHLRELYVSVMASPTEALLRRLVMNYRAHIIATHHEEKSIISESLSGRAVLERALNGEGGTTNPPRYFTTRTADDPGETQKSP